MKVTIEHYGRKVSIEVDEDIQFSTFIEDVIKPLSVFTYGDKLWSKYFEEAE